MSAAYQVLGAVAIVVGLAGTWLAARNRAGWIVCVASSAMWLPALVTGSQWVAVANCGLSVAVCARNFLAAVQVPHRPPASARRPPRAILVIDRPVRAGAGARRS